MSSSPAVRRSPHTSGFSPPQSAQPYQSIFGGPSSQDVPDQIRYSSINGEGEDRASSQGEDDGDVVMGEDGEEQEAEDAEEQEEEFIVEQYSDENDPSYEESAEDGSDDEAGSHDETEKGRMPSVHGDGELVADRPLHQSVARKSPSKSLSPSPPAYRPNRFRGPESTWRKLTLEDRQNAQALEEIRARDLAAHLYNAHALRVRAREILQNATGHQAQAEHFVPPKRWTAWPMTASEVPRVGEHLRRQEDDAWTLRKPPDLRLSADLEESLIATMQRMAKERFNARSWKGTKSSRVGRIPDPESVAPEDGPESTGPDTEIKSDPDLPETVPLRPVVQADDEVSRRQLRPLARRTLSHLDDLLMGLHHARKTCVRAEDSSASEWQTDTESVVSRTSSPEQTRGRRGTDRSQSRGRKRMRRTSRQEISRDRSNALTDSTEETPAPRRRSVPQPSSRSRSRPLDSDRKRSATRLRQRLRDWSDILGIASMTGWPTPVVMRTAQRSAQLFGEDMEFRTIKQGTVQRVKHDKVWTWEYAESEDEESPPPASKRKSTGKRPISRPASGREDSQPGRSTDQPALTGKSEHRKMDIVCPIPECLRHIDGFSRTWNLNLHMKRMHPERPLRSSARSSPQSEPAGESFSEHG